MTATHSLVSVVDDDESVRESLPDLLREFGFASQAFSSAEEFLASDSVDKTKCLILDIAMPGMTGPDLQRELTRRRQEIPIVFITADADETISTLSPGMNMRSTSAPTPQAVPIVFVVEDDVSVRESLELLSRCASWQAETFASAREFLSRPRALAPSCLVLDVGLPDLSGLDLQKIVAW